MYRIAIVRKGQPADSRICADDSELRSAVDDLIHSQGSKTTEADNEGLAALVGSARSMADTTGFAALKFGSAGISIRPIAPNSAA